MKNKDIDKKIDNIVDSFVMSGADQEAMKVIYKVMSKFGWAIMFINNDKDDKNDTKKR